MTLHAQEPGVALTRGSPTAAAIGIRISDLHHKYGKVPVLDDVNLTIKPGEFHCLLGPSGCGKSTLLYLIGGFLPVQAGSIQTAKGLVTRPSPDRGIVFQSFALFPWKTVMQNVLYGMENIGIPRKERVERARSLIEMVHLGRFADAYPSQLSGGMQQRAAIARTLAIDPDILLMDEPFGALDAQTRRVMQEELLAIWRRTGKIVVFVTHDVQEAVMLADRISVMGARPGLIKQIVDTDFNQDPNSNLNRAAEFTQTVGQVWDMVRQEALLAARAEP